jgi:hypothetical protein
VDPLILPTRKADPKARTSPVISQSAPSTPLRNSKFAAKTPVQLVNLVDDDNISEDSNSDSDGSRPLSFHFFGKEVPENENSCTVDLGRSIPQNLSKTQQTCARTILQNWVMLNDDLTGIQWLQGLFEFLNGELIHQQSVSEAEGLDYDIVGNKFFPTVFICQPHFLYATKEDAEEALEEEFQVMVELFNQYATKLYPRPILVMFINYGNVIPWDKGVPIDWIRVFWGEYFIKEKVAESNYRRTVVQMFLLNGSTKEGKWINIFFNIF